MKLDTQNNAAIGSKLYFDKFRVYEYSNGTYSFENYLARFDDVVKCLTWGRAMDSAVNDRADALKRIKDLECDSNIVGQA